VCDPDEALELLMRMRPGARSPATASRRRGGRGDAADAVRADGEGTEQPPAEPVDERQFEQLRKWRWERAQGKPAFTVAANAVLDDVLRRRPRSIEELLEIRGIGPAFCEKHGDSLLAALEAC
jgi:superfamily II DNA helicase RecQ